MVAYVRDESLHARLNAEQRNYWDIYIEEMLNHLGVRGTAVPLAALEEESRLKAFRVLIVGWESGQHFSERTKNGVRRWVQEGGLLIGFGVRNLDDVFGIEFASDLAQSPEEFSLSGRFEWWPHPLTHDVHAFLSLDQKLLIFSRICRVALRSSAELARLYSPAHEDLLCPAVVWNRFGKGWAGYFAFDAAKTVWILHQGRPLPDVPEAERSPKASQLSALGQESHLVRYADEICHVLQNMIAQSGQPFISPIPPMGDTVPEALLYWSGDEYRGPTEWSLKTSDYMKSLGLPFHINIEIGNHPMTLEELRHIQANGHEVSLYWELKAEEGYRIYPDLFRRQSDLLMKKFGLRPGSTLLWSARWKGWTEPARWMMEAGARADNSFPNKNLAPNHPYHNAATFGFNYGTSFPFYFYEDYSHDNRRLDFMEQPIVCYELGHHVSLRGQNAYNDPEMPTLEDVHLPIDVALKYHLVMNMFYHPSSVVRRPATRAGIEEILRYIEYRKGKVLHMSNNQVCDWWDARTRSSVENLSESDGRVCFECACEYPAGMVVNLLVRKPGTPTVRCDDKAAVAELRKEFGGRWLYIIVPQGRHRVEVAHSPGAQ